MAEVNVWKVFLQLMIFMSRFVLYMCGARCTFFLSLVIWNACRYKTMSIYIYKEANSLVRDDNYQLSQLGRVGVVFPLTSCIFVLPWSLILFESQARARTSREISIRARKARVDQVRSLRARISSLFLCLSLSLSLFLFHGPSRALCRESAFHRAPSDIEHSPERDKISRATRLDVKRKKEKDRWMWSLRLNSCRDHEIFLDIIFFSLHLFCLRHWHRLETMRKLHSSEIWDRCLVDLQCIAIDRILHWNFIFICRFFFCSFSSVCYECFISIDVCGRSHKCAYTHTCVHVFQSLMQGTHMPRAHAKKGRHSMKSFIDFIVRALRGLAIYSVGYCFISIDERGREKKIEKDCPDEECVI